MSFALHDFEETNYSRVPFRREILVGVAKGTGVATHPDGDMWDAIYYLSIVLFLAVAMIGVAFVVRSRLSGASPMQAMGGFFGPKPERRLGISEQYNVDSKRRLILIRRDDVEHLIMTGGPVDVLIEQGIAAPRDHAPGAAPASSAASTVTSRANLRI